MLVDHVGEIPPSAISLLSKGLGFVPTPEAVNVLDTRLDMRLTVNKIISSSKDKTKYKSRNNSNAKATDPPQSPMFPSKLSRKFYGTSTPSDDKDVNDIVNSMETELDQLLQSSSPKIPKKLNLTPEEKRGLKWLQDHVDSHQIAITPADKGGSILIVDPELLRKKTLEKLENPSLYRKLDKDPLPKLHEKLFSHWVKGKENSFISAEEAKFVMGVSNNPKSTPDLSHNYTSPTNRPSTAPHYKPGKSYFYPSLKIHKLKCEDLKPGVEPPVQSVS